MSSHPHHLCFIWSSEGTDGHYLSIVTLGQYFILQILPTPEKKSSQAFLPTHNNKAVLKHKLMLLLTIMKLVIMSINSTLALGHYEQSPFDENSATYYSL